MTTDPGDDPALPPKNRKRRYRERRQEAGYHQVAVWLDGDAYALLGRLMELQRMDAAAAISAALTHHHGVVSDKLYVAAAKTLFTTIVPSHIPDDETTVPRNVPRDKLGGKTIIPSPAPSVPRNSKNVPRHRRSRYMSPALEDRILALRESGLSLSATARELATEGHFNAKGAPYSTSTVSKAEARSKARRLAQSPPIKPANVAENET